MANKSQEQTCLENTIKLLKEEIMYRLIELKETVLFRVTGHAVL